MSGTFKKIGRHPFLGLMVSLACSASLAQEVATQDPSADLESTSKLKLSGFGTLGYYGVSRPDNLRFRREIGENGPKVNAEPYLADSRLGAQINYQLTPSVELVGQVVAREHAAWNFEDTIEWAFAKYSASENLTLRAGRVGMDTFMLSDYRNVGYAYNWVRPPQEFYGWFSIYSIDGADAVYSMPLGDGQLKSKVFAGTTNTGMPYGSESYKLTSTIQGFGATWELDEWSVRAYHTQGKFTNGGPFLDFIPGLNLAWPSGSDVISQLNLKGNTIYYTMLGASWNHDGWQLSGEFAHTRSTTLFSPQGDTAYISLGHRFDNWVPYISFARSWSQNSLDTSSFLTFGIPDLDTAKAGLIRAFKATRTDQHTLSLGTRWDITNNVALKLQVDHVELSGKGMQMWDTNPPQTPWPGGSKRIVSATLDFIF